MSSKARVRSPMMSAPKADDVGTEGLDFFYDGADGNLHAGLFSRVEKGARPI
jgi:hypothetical protein